MTHLLRTLSHQVIPAFLLTSIYEPSWLSQWPSRCLCEMSAFFFFKKEQRGKHLKRLQATDERCPRTTETATHAPSTSLCLSKTHLHTQPVVVVNLPSKWWKKRQHLSHSISAPHPHPLYIWPSQADNSFSCCVNKLKKFYSSSEENVWADKKWGEFEMHKKTYCNFSSLGWK